MKFWGTHSQRSGHRDLKPRTPGDAARDNICGNCPETSLLRRHGKGLPRCEETRATLPGGCPGQHQQLSCKLWRLVNQSLRVLQRLVGSCFWPRCSK